MTHTEDRLWRLHKDNGVEAMRNAAPVAIGITENGAAYEFFRHDAFLGVRCEVIILKRNHPMFEIDPDDPHYEEKFNENEEFVNVVLRGRLASWGQWIEANLG